MRIPPRRPWRLLSVLGVMAFGIGSLLGWAVGGDDQAVTAAEPTTTAAPDGTTTAPEATTTVAPSTTVDPDAPPRSQTGAGNPVTFVFGGDIHFDGPLRTTLERQPDSVLAGLQPTLREADVAVVNLETSIGEGGTKVPKDFNFQAPPAAFDVLMAGGVDVIGMANNHALDYGTDGLTQTIGAAQRVQAPIIGIGGNELAAYAPWTRTVNGQRIAVIAATSVLDGNLVASWSAAGDRGGVASAKRLDALLTAVRTARAAADTVVVFLHWGTEGTFCPNADQLSLAPKLVEAGADIVVGGHAHRVLSGGYLQGAYVDYGLGNLVFKAGGSDGRDTGLLRVTATGRRIDAAEWLPGRIGSNYLPTLLEGAERDAELATWNQRRDCTRLSPTPDA